MHFKSMKLKPEFSKILKKALSDLTTGVFLFDIWWGLAWQEIIQRYARSIIGPFWLTLSMGVLIAVMGPLYGVLFGQNIAGYIQYLALSMILWGFISSCLNEAGSVFISAEGYIKQVSLPLSIYVLKLITKNLLIFFHNAVVGFIVLIFLPPAHFQSIWMVPLGLLLVVANLFWFVLLVGMVSARYRDFPQLVTNLVTVMFFLSPIMWKTDMLTKNQRFLADINPLYHMIEIIRAPLLGTSIHIYSWFYCIGLLIFGSILAFAIFVRFRARVAYWL
jgi:ABC-type polysaccharide/polyol phosphate export permease